MGSPHRDAPHLYITQSHPVIGQWISNHPFFGIGLFDYPQSCSFQTNGLIADFLSVSSRLGDWSPCRIKGVKKRSVSPSVLVNIQGCPYWMAFSQSRRFCQVNRHRSGLFIGQDANHVEQDGILLCRQWVSAAECINTHVFHDLS